MNDSKEIAYACFVILFCGILPSAHAIAIIMGRRQKWLTNLDAWVLSIAGAFFFTIIVFVCYLNQRFP